MKLKMPIALASQKNTVYYLGEIEYRKKWLLDQELEGNDDKKKNDIIRNDTTSL